MDNSKQPPFAKSPTKTRKERLQFMKPLKERVSISLDPDVIEETKKLAEEADRPFSQYINIVLKYNIKNQKKKQDIL